MEEMNRATAPAGDGEIDLAELARIWKGGCIIRAALLADIEGAIGSGALLAAPVFGAQQLERCAQFVIFHVGGRIVTTGVRPAPLRDGGC